MGEDVETSNDDESTPTKLQEGMDKYMSAISRQVR